MIRVKLDTASVLIDYAAATSSTSLDDEDPSTGRTVLQLAVRHGWSSLVARLIQLGADLNRRDLDWKTAFIDAVECNRRDIIPLLVS